MRKFYQGIVVRLYGLEN